MIRTAATLHEWSTLMTNTHKKIQSSVLKSYHGLKKTTNEQLTLTLCKSKTTWIWKNIKGLYIYIGAK